MDRHARVVVIGGGNMGAGVLYHLAKSGWKDCVLIEKAELTSGATWHAVGLVTRMVGSHTLGALHDYAVEFYKSIEAETEQNVSWHNCGSLRVASSDDHVDWLMHVRDVVLARGKECHWLGPNEVKALNPLYDVSKLRGGIYTPDDGHVDPSGACQAMAKGARLYGAEIIRRNRVVDVQPLPSGEWRVITENGSLTCEHVVNAGGYHARQIGAFVGLDLPILPIQHHYVVTEAVPEFAQMSREIPVTRDDYFTGYIRREQKGALIGLYDTHGPVPKWADGCPWESESELFEPDWDSITPWLEKSFERCPSLRELGIKRVVNGALTCTPDGSPLLGPAAGLRNFWLACGATGGIMWGPGAGKYLAQWIMHGAADISMRTFDPRRFGSWVDRSYAVERTIDDYAHRLSLPYPQDQHYSCRGKRLSGVHHITSRLGAIYEEIGGRERPRLYGPAYWHDREPRSWRRTAAFDLINQEARRVYEGVGIGDFSPFAKFEITGSGAHDFLNRVCANRIPQKAGSTCLTTYLNDRGTIEGEATIACLAPDRYWFVTGGPSELRAWDWLEHQLGESARVQMFNRTNVTGVLTVAGPQARETLQKCTSADLSNEAFGWLKAREMELAGVPVMALRLSFTGELAWELHAPMERLDVLWNELCSAGRRYGITPFGSAAMNAMRMEKAYRGGMELGGDTSPIHAGIMNFVKLDKEFVGRDAIVRRMEKGETSTLVYMEVDAKDQDCLGGELVLAGGEKIGSVTSGAYGPITQKSLAFAYVDPRFATGGTELQVSILGRLLDARVLDKAVRDPENLRLKT
ncbi:MAG: FAD-dependent oxidoreductase [Pseudobdellovibrionaceae bacterium]